MEIPEQLHLAEVIHDYRERLERTRADIAAAFGGSAEAESSAIVRLREVESRMLDVENYLANDAENRLARRAERWRLRDWTAPGICRLRHHSPQTLRVPTSYYAARPPRPAPSIALVTPSYEQGGFIERTLYSVVAQGYPALEYVVQDGGSTDETLEVLHRYERWLTAWTSEPDGGQADAINRGFSRTNGEIMGYLNSDDLLLPGSLSYVAAFFRDHPEVDVVYGHRVLIDEHDRDIGAWVLPPHDHDELALVDFVPQETLFWRRRAWEAVGGQLDTRLEFAIDWDLLLRLRDTPARMVRVPRFLGAFRVHGEQKTIRRRDACIEECDRLRRRVHGQAMFHDQAMARAAPYLRRQLVYQAAHRVARRVPRSRTRVRTLPMEPWLRGPDSL